MLLQHVARRGLVFERFREIVGRSRNSPRRTRILHRDHGLGGEVLDEGDLLVAERATLAGRS